MQIVVLGMHRSGTSAVTRVINLMGAYFGAESMSTGANWENPAGFWERRDVRGICDGVLHGSDVDWWKPARFVPNEVPDVVQRAALDAWQSVIDELDGHRPWVVKEPRLCLVLPLLRPTLEAPVAVHVHREPLEVAASLQERNGFPMHVGLALWEFYTVSALSASKDLPRVHVWYADLLTDPMRTLADMQASMSDAGVTGLRVPNEADVRGFITQSLHRQRRQRDEHRGRLSIAQVELLSHLRGARASEDTPLQPSPGAMEVLRTFEEKEGSRIELKDELRSLQDELDARDLQLATLQQALQDAHASKERLAERTIRLEAALREEETSHRTSTSLARSLEAQLEKAAGDYARLRGRRSVRASLALAELARPLLRLAYRTRRA